MQSDVEQHQTVQSDVEQLACLTTRTTMNTGLYEERYIPVPCGTTGNADSHLRHALTSTHVFMSRWAFTEYS